MEKVEHEKLEERKMRGEEFNKVKLANMKPPIFVQPQKKKLLFYVDVNITPTK